MYELLPANLPSWFKALDFSAWCTPALAGTLYLLNGGESRSGLSAHFPVDISNLLESIPDMAIILDKRGRVVEANSAAIRTAGHLGDKLIGMPIQELTQRLQVTDGVSPAEFAGDRRGLTGDVSQRSNHAGAGGGDGAERTPDAAPAGHRDHPGGGGFGEPNSHPQG